MGWLSGIYFVDTNNYLIDAQCLSQKDMLNGLPILRDASFKFTNISCNSQDNTVSMSLACNHGFD